jgi:hypothetical protein
VEVLLEAAEWGEDVRLAEVLEMIDAGPTPEDSYTRQAVRVGRHPR